MKDKKSRPSIAGGSSWRRYEARVMDLVLRALELLRSAGVKPRNENQLNREFYAYLMTALAEIRARGENTDNLLPWPECKNLPHPDDPERIPRENKIPDFQWGYYDDLAPAAQARRTYVLECKRLGAPPRRDWVLNSNYVEHGIARFLHEEHGYGKGEHSGMMIGYVESMELELILAEVNGAAAEVPVPNLVLDGDWQGGGTSQLEHVLTRKAPSRPIVLRHLWVDLRT